MGAHDFGEDAVDVAVISLTNVDFVYRKFQASLLASRTRMKRLSFVAPTFIVPRQSV